MTSKHYYWMILALALASLTGCQSVAVLTGPGKATINASTEGGAEIKPDANLDLTQNKVGETTETEAPAETAPGMLPVGGDGE